MLSQPTFSGGHNVAHFRATIQGGRGEASRLGTRSSSLQTVAASWQGAVRVELYERDGMDYARISLAPHRGVGVNRLLFDGRVDGAAEALDEIREAAE